MALPLVAEAKPLFCQQPYALCSMAKCIPSTTEPNKLLCFCRTFDGVSLSQGEMESCSQLQPFRSNGVDYIYSTFSPKMLEYGFTPRQFPAHVAGTNTPLSWANCMNQRCTRLPNNKALCSCEEGQSDPAQPFVTFYPAQAPTGSFCLGSQAKVSDRGATQWLYNNAGTEAADPASHHQHVSAPIRPALNRLFGAAMTTSARSGRPRSPTAPRAKTRARGHWH